MRAQAALPFKSKPKQEAPRKRQSLEARRAVVLEPGERRAGQPGRAAQRAAQRARRQSAAPSRPASARRAPIRERMRSPATLGRCCCSRGMLPGGWVLLARGA